MHTRETCLQKYKEYRLSLNGATPQYLEFLKYAGINRDTLNKLFGSQAYSKLQEESGDTPNRLQLERTPVELIMRQYGDLVTEVSVLPAYAEWAMRNLKPTQSGLNKIHNMKWSDLPMHFVEWVENHKITEYKKAIEIIANSTKKVVNKSRDGDEVF